MGFTRDTPIWAHPSARRLIVGGVFLTYSVLAVAAYWPTSPVSSHLIMNCGCHDAAQEAWLLAWPLYAMTHAHNFAYTNWIGFPQGVNLMDNTAMPLLGVLSAPVVASVGPVAAYNLLLRVAFAVSASSAFFVMRRWHIWLPAAFLGGLVYGFSPFLVGEGLGHVFLVFAPVPPLIFLVLSELFLIRRRTPWKLGLALGALAVAQFYIAAEILATTAILSVIAVAVVLVGDRREALSRIRYALPGLGVAVLFFVVCTAYAIWFLLYGTQHIVGSPHPLADLNRYRADLLSAIVPTDSQLFRPFNLAGLGNRLVGDNTTETGAYVGIPLLLVLTVVVVIYRRDLRVRLAALMALVAYVLSMGINLRVDGTATGIPLPFAVLQHLPFVRDADAGRFSLYTGFFIAVLVAVGLTRLHDALRAAPRDRLLALRVGSSLAVMSLCLAPLIPNLPYSEVPAGVPAFFRSGAVARIPPTSVLLAYPYPYTPNDQAMLWSAEAGMRFRIIGGQAAIPGAGGTTTSAPAQLAPASVEQLFLTSLLGPTPPAPTAPPLDATTEAQVRQFIVRYDVKTIVVDPVGLRPARVIAFLAKALHSRPTVEGGVEVWFRTDLLARSGLTSSSRAHHAR